MPKNLYNCSISSNLINGLMDFYYFSSSFNLISPAFISNSVQVPVMNNYSNKDHWYQWCILLIGETMLLVNDLKITPPKWPHFEFSAGTSRHFESRLQLSKVHWLISLHISNYLSECFSFGMNEQDKKWMCAVCVCHVDHVTGELHSHRILAKLIFLFSKRAKIPF